MSSPRVHANHFTLTYQRHIKLADGGAHIWQQLNILHEPLLPDLMHDYGGGPSEPTPLLEYQTKALERGDYLARYMEYWNSTVEHTGTGRAVDAVILPVAPHAGVIPGKYFHYGELLPWATFYRRECQLMVLVTGYTEIANLLNFTAAAIPVTTVDESIDRPSSKFAPKNATDQKNWDACKDV